MRYYNKLRNAGPPIRPFRSRLCLSICLYVGTLIVIILSYTAIESLRRGSSVDDFSADSAQAQPDSILDTISSSNNLILEQSDSAAVDASNIISTDSDLSILNASPPPSPLEKEKEMAKDDNTIHVALIFDHNRYTYALQVIRSITYHAARQIEFHLITDDRSKTKIQLIQVPTNIRLHFYDYAHCQRPTIQTVMAFSNPKIHQSAHCKFFLHEILSSIDKVLYLDSDVTAVQDISSCWDKHALFSEVQFLGMSVDMGEVCQQFPNLCWPMAFEWNVPSPLVCGQLRRRARRFNATKEGEVCPKPGQTESVQLNGGMALMDLRKMRAFEFTEKYVQAIVRTARIAGFKKARWGEQDFINSFFRVYPEALYRMPCGCNYQYTAVRREVKCANQSVYIAHGWTSGTRKKSKDPFNQHFFYFKEDIGKPGLLPPKVPLISSYDVDSPIGEFTYNHSLSCPHQSYSCNEETFWDGNVLVNDDVYVLTRTSGRPAFFEYARASVLEQTHPYVHHLVLTDNEETSRTYLTNVSHTLVPSLYHEYDPQEPCVRCHGDPKRSCANAPPLTEPEKRDEFLKCFCDTNYPMNFYMNALHEQVKSGWIIYLDDDNLLLDKYSIAELLAHAKSRDDLLLWKSLLKRITPSPGNFGRIVRGDVDASGFMFHSKHIESTAWTKKRCGDYATVASLGKVLRHNWIDHMYTGANPLRNQLGGLGLRGDMRDKVTVIITSHDPNGFRPSWLRRTLSAYSSPKFRHIVHKAILVWNNPTADPPEFSDPIVVLKMARNSLNNRWVETIPHIETDAILNVDDDVFVDFDGIVCMLSMWMEDKDRLVGPFVRRTAEDTNAYILDELLQSQSYSLALPRAFLVHRKFLEMYRDGLPNRFRQYVDAQDGHCDDITMNVMMANATKKEPLRVLLPPETIVDYFDSCYAAFREDTGGLALQRNRAKLRSECVGWILKEFNMDKLKYSKTIGVCGPRGIPMGKTNKAPESLFKAMKRRVRCSASV